MISTAPITDK